MASENNGLGSPQQIRDADDIKVTYSQVQAWSFSESDVILSFFRFEPKTLGGKEGVQHNLEEQSWVRDVVMYMPLSQVESMARGLLEGIKSSKTASKKA